MANKTKIVLDADVIIHFIKAGQFSLLLDIFPEYQYLILDVVYNEVTKHRGDKDANRQHAPVFQFKNLKYKVCPKRRVYS